MASTIQNAMKFIANPKNTKSLASDDIVVVGHVIKEFNKSVKKNAPVRFIVVPHRSFTLQEYVKKRKADEVDTESEVPVYIQQQQLNQQARSHTFLKEKPFSVSSFEVDRKVSGKICKVELSNLKLNFWQPSKKPDEEKMPDPVPSVVCDIKYLSDDILDKGLTATTLSVPKFEDLSSNFKYTTVTLPVVSEALSEGYKDVCAAIPVCYIKDREVFVREDKDTQEETITLWQQNGYPFLVKREDETLLAYVKIYNNNTARPDSNTVVYSDFLSKFGISNVDNWAIFAPYLLGNISGFFMGYFNNDEVRIWQQNQEHAEVEENGFKPDMKITVTATYFHVNIVDTVKRAGIQVDYEFVSEKFGKVSKLFSDDAENNYFYRNRKQLNKEFLNLNEFNGDLEELVNDSGNYTYWLLGNWENKPESIESAGYEEWQIFAIKV